MSERSLRRKLTDSGFSCQGLVESVRKARALELLSYSNRSIAEVAAETGFADVRNFRKAFKRYTGVLPSEIRCGER
jgi:AraC-like DNA-binding protein